ncbi:hypothetical protein [Kitasatospora sp. NBC_01266]|uniref:hypothetical protein n=1 Tax=Kitasatospora sp. NBC_01266 TaxID=2903572 RepID=UPI002E326B6C|nr:hypothetical protein [Kitasatospora sp. NBC_01266]
MPECRCPADCGGRPEAAQRLTLAYPAVRPVGTHPPELRYEPRRRGELVYDALNQRLGVFMDQVGRIVYLRPERGGPEWEADPEWLEKPPPARQAAGQPGGGDPNGCGAPLST